MFTHFYSTLRFMRQLLMHTRITVLHSYRSFRAWLPRRWLKPFAILHKLSLLQTPFAFAVLDHFPSAVIVTSPFSVSRIPVRYWACHRGHCERSRCSLLVDVRWSASTICVCLRAITLTTMEVSFAHRLGIVGSAWRA